MRSLLAALVALLLLAGCATHYVSSFHVRPVAADSFILTARLNPRPSRDQVMKEVLVRAAQETVARGFDWFTLRRLNLASVEPAAEDVSDGLALRSYGGRMRPYGWRRGYRPARAPKPRDYEVRMFHGDKPVGTAGFVARDLLQTVRR
jgi:hypothetical protein